jgi:hypothetical protein
MGTRRYAGHGSRAAATVEGRNPDAHGQGYDMVGRPLIHEDETMRLEAGMNLAVHPGYESASQWAVICDNYLVETAGVSDCLHRTEKKIFEV